MYKLLSLGCLNSRAQEFSKAFSWGKNMKKISHSIEQVHESKS